ncbi:hypothetical protein [Nocardia sp. NPDC059228]|uniref:hypothetical protein n=1 Tax=Nocardia sp. NPDC059228 TaxID=3346777 RepID=UPI003698B3E1
MSYEGMGPVGRRFVAGSVVAATAVVAAVTVAVPSASADYRDDTLRVYGNDFRVGTTYRVTIHGTYATLYVRQPGSDQPVAVGQDSTGGLPVELELEWTPRMRGTHTLSARSCVRQYCSDGGSMDIVVR